MSRQVDYRPDPKPAPPSFDHMQEVLSRHARHPAPDEHGRVVAVDPPPRLPAPLEWLTAHEKGPDGLMHPTPYARASACGRFTISKAQVKGQWLYSVWEVKTKTQLKTRIGSFEDAKQFAQAHVENQHA